MGYYVKPLSGNKKRTWKLQIQSEAGGDRKITDIPIDQLGDHQFHLKMTLEEAQAKSRDLNRLKEIHRHAERKVSIKKRMEKEAIQSAVSFPDETEFLSWLRDNQRFASIKENKTDSHWHNAKKIIATIGLKPTDYADKKQAIYRWFATNSLSISYLQKVLRLINLYGRFYSRKYKVYFEEVEMPTGYARSDIEDAFFEKNPDGRAAKPMTPELLESKRSKFKPEHWNWVYLSTWLGLRPGEVDSLTVAKNYRLEIVSGKSVVWVYQSKLTGIPRADRWKPIPLIESEQKRVLALLESKDFKKPLVKTMAMHFGEGFALYSGRKGFESIMRDRGYSLENIAQWLGHQSIETTWKKYVNKKNVRWDKAS